jgi:hypothetical protein
MSKWFLIALSVSFAAIGSTVLTTGGCVSKEPMPEITYDYKHEKPVAPRRPAISKAQPREHVYENIPSEWMPPVFLERNWTAIILHHSATDNGNAAIFDKWHREGNNWEGVGYDFVIGNGSDSGNGQVEVTFRWSNQKTGAHCGGTPGNWANKEGVGICLVGNFNKYPPTPQQLRSAVRLIRFLQDRYGIDAGRIYGHNTTPGGRTTDCPGQYFSMWELKAMLR